MNSVQKMIANLSPEKQELFLQRLRAGKEPVKRALIPVQSRDKNIFNLSFAQQRLWFLEQLEPGSTTYLIPHIQSFSGALNVQALERSLHELVVRHESLRTTFEERSGQPVQIIHPAPRFTLPVLDLSGLATEHREREALALAEQEVQRPCDLTQGPLFRTYLVRLEPQKHLLTLTQHHIITDGSSIVILARELTTLYQAFVAGLPSPLTPLPIQYVDYALWQREWLQGEVLATQLAYWRTQLAGIEPLAFPLDHSRPAFQTSHGARKMQIVPLAIQASLQRLSQQEGVTMFMLLLAAFQALLQRYTGQADISVGTPIANRTRAEIEGVVGFFINTLVLRSDLSGDPSFKQFLANVRATCLQAYAHQDIPFEKVVEEIEPGRDLNRSPLFQVMFVLQETATEQREVAGLRTGMVSAEHNSSKFDLTLSAIQTAQGLCCYLEYNTDLFESKTIDRLLEHWQILLTGIVQTPQARLSDLPLLSTHERELLLGQWNDTVEDLSQVLCLHQLFEKQVRQTPDAVALVFEEQMLTYADLNRRANQLAHYLRRQGVGPDRLVGLCMERSMEMVIGILAVLKAGGAYVPIDPAYPAERQAFMLDDAHVTVVLTQRAQPGKTPLHAVQIICLDSNEQTYSNESGDNMDNLVTAENLAYVIYTSGSTGTPKGVMVHHANVFRLFASTQHWFAFDSQDVWTNFHSYAFDFSVWEIWGALLYGGRLLIVPYEVSRVPTTFYHLLLTQHVTVLNQTPSAFRQLMQAEETIPRDGQVSLALRLIIFGGEALDLPSLRPWFERHGDDKPQLVNMYGITETTVHVTYRPLRMQDVFEGAGSMIGAMIPDLQLYILDEYLHLVPIGVPGQLYVGGPGLARGYLNHPELTGERFVAHPFQTQRGARLYKTGDLARFRPNKDIEYLGRIDHQVKIRGFRIELGEIEDRIVKYPDIVACAVMVREDTLHDKRLVAYVVPRSDVAAPSSSDLRRFLLEMLPDYMVPAIFVMISDLPYTLNGKLDRRALPVPDQVRPDLAEALVLPRTPTEEILAGIWISVLGIEQVGIHDNFFALGGDSIRSIQVLSQARERGIHFSLRQLFQHQTIHELVQVVGAEAYRAHLTEDVQAFGLISPQDRLKLPLGVEDAYPLTMLQSGMIFHSQYNPDSAVYHDLFSYQIQVALDVSLFQTAIQRLVACHSMLRVAFDLDTFSEPLQLVYQDVHIPVQIDDLSLLAPGEQDEMITAWLDAERNRSFDWTHAPLLNFHIHRRSETVFQFTMSFHHAILDGWSVASFLTELFKEYLSLLKGDMPASKMPPTVQFRDFVALERKFLALEDAKQFWLQKLAGSSSAVLPRWAASRRVTAVPVHQQPVQISQETSASLKRLAQTLAVPVKSVLLAAHLRVLSFLYGQSDVLTGLVSNGRLESTDGERTLGLFLNTLPLRMQLSHGTWTELIQETFAAECELLSYRWYPLSEIQKHQGRHALFEIVFNFIHFHVYQSLMEVGTHEDEMQILGSSGFEETNFALTANFSLDLVTSQIRLSLLGRTAELSIEQIEAIGEYYELALSSIANEPDRHYAFQSLLSEREREQQLIEWNSTQQTVPDELYLHRLFEQQAQLTPDAIALVFEEHTLTYGTLDRLSNQLAHYLRKLNIGPDEPVGLCQPRSIEMMIGLLAVLKAGGAYVPLDATYPAARLQWLLHESHPRVVLAHSSLLSVLSAAGVDCHFLCLDASQKEWLDEPMSRVQTQMSPDNLAYMIYTSGSTGNPKGVMCSHRAASNHLLWIRQVMDLNKRDRVLQKAPLSFDASVTECFVSLTCGGSVVLARPDGQKDPAYLVEIIEREQVSLAQFVPSLLRLWIEEPGIERCTALRNVISAGEILSADMQKRCLMRCPAGVQLYNLYGPTEAATDVSYWLCQPDWNEPANSSNIPIGRPIMNIRMYVLDQYLQPVPIGVEGDVYLAGMGLARGYFQRPDLTAERFIPDPFQPGGRLYRTGDLGCMRADGSMEYVGRVDEQVKLRGIRIEIGEIEAVLGKHPQVRECAVLVRDGRTGEKQLAAYMVAEQHVVLSIQDIRKYLQEQLPEYMVPAQIMQLDVLPLMPNGKLDRKSLPDPGVLSSPTNIAFFAPRTAVEKELSAIWADVLRLKQVGIRDNFFELGGDSIISIQIIARAKQKGLQLTLKQLFQYPTVEELSLMVDGGALVEAEQGLVLGSVPLTPIQHWFFDLHLPMLQHWNQAMFFEVAERIHSSFLEKVVGAWFQHHDALRLRFIPSDDGWQQYVSDVEEILPFLVVDLSMLAEHEQKAVATQRAAEAQASLDLSRGPLARIILFDMGKDRPQCLLITIHHLAIDGVSWRILLEDLQTAYQQLKQGDIISLPAKTSSFKAWAESLVAYAQSAAIQQEQMYWLTRKAAYVQPLPLDFPALGQLNSVESARTVSVSLTDEETKMLLEEVPGMYHTQVNDILLTALAQTFAAWTDTSSLLIDLEGHGREDLFEKIDISRTVGWFTSIFPVHLQLPAASSLEETIRSVKEQLRAIPDHGIGYGILRYLNADTSLTRELHAQPAAEVAFNYLGQFNQAQSAFMINSASHLSSGPTRNMQGRRTHLIEVNCYVSENQLQVSWGYSARFHRHVTIEHLATTFAQALRAIIQHGQTSGSGGYMPTDFPNVELSQEQLEQIAFEMDLD
ncbi:non-ribosomal peptide synthetase [Ktedonobacteria bacterium brp13]|nr:non-ribosomal peptide synthetase [Ktedonobacteria bacterium brp13]